MVSFAFAVRVKVLPRPADFLLKIGPKTSGSKHLLLFTEEIPPGGGYSEAQTPPPVESPEHVFARTNYESVQQQFEDSQKEYDDRKQKEERCQAFPVEHPVTPESVDQHMVGCSYQTRKSRFVMEKVSEALAHYRTQLNDVDVCVKTYKDTIDKKLSDQTTREVGQIKTCQAEDLYPPATNDTKR